jgi:hypothetical protein
MIRKVDGLYFCEHCDNIGVMISIEEVNYEDSNEVYDEMCVDCFNTTDDPKLKTLKIEDEDILDLQKELIKLDKKVDFLRGKKI